MEWVEVSLEEYKTLREEVLASMSHQHSIITYGTAAVGIVLTGGLNLWKDALLLGVILLGIIPIISYLVLVVWMGEVIRMNRAGFFLTGLENRINEAFPDCPNVLTWENTVRTRKKENRLSQVFWNYISIIGLFILLALASIILGDCRVSKEVTLFSFIFLNVIELFVLLSVITFLFVQGRKIAKDIRLSKD